MKRLALMFLAIFPLIAGCSPYVNIPEQPGDFATTDASGRNVRAVCAVALKRVLLNQPPQGQYAIALPRGASSIAYDWVLQRLPEGGTRHTPGAVDRPVYSVAAIYIRGNRAQVDVVFPAASGKPRLMTVWQKSVIDGWLAVRHRVWELSVEEALAGSRPTDADE